MKLKVGSVVWAFSEEQDCVMSYEVDFVDGINYEASATDIPNDECMDEVMFRESDIGMLVFLTREEAAQHHEFERKHK